MSSCWFLIQLSQIEKRSNISNLQIFGPNCAWLKAILKVLKELHEQPDMKLNLKFEIEVLCKELQVDLAKLDADKVLKDTDRLVKMDEQLCAVKPLKQPDMQALL